MPSVAEGEAKARQGKARQGKARQGKARQGKARQGKARGSELGRKTAAGIIALRASDGSSAPESYRPYTSAGVYVPTTLPASLTAGGVTPWVMKTGSQFRPAPPPLNSPTWTKDLNEIQEIGSRTSTKRTVAQTDIGCFWFTSGPQTWNPILRQVAASKGLNLIDCARLFALAAIASNDAFIAVFDAKYAFNFWRPITAIRNADLSDNKATLRDASWLPLDAPRCTRNIRAHIVFPLPRSPPSFRKWSGMMSRRSR